VVKILKRYGLEKVRLTGGEPMLRKNIELLIKGLKDDALVNEVSITTNGSLLDHDKIRLLKTNGLDAITISLDSLSQDITDQLNPTNNNILKVLNSIDNALKIFGTLKIKIAMKLSIW